MADDDIAAAELAKQIAALRPRLQGPRGVLAYLEKPPADKRSDVNKTFLASTIRGVNSHNRRQEEDKCWTLRRMKQQLDDVPSSTRRHSRDRRKRRRSPSRSRSRSRSRSQRRGRDRSGSRRSSSRRSRSRDRGPNAETDASKKKDEDERSFWARKKAEKTRELWENLHAEGTVSVENAPDFTAEESDDEDVKPPAATDRKEKKHKKHKKHVKHKKKSDKRRRSRS
ncbi:uncharacterized protein KRP23_15070 [Phytophthora ramorum]|uniref:uncharacterized protein n=1 Tax=Phytophthora ramorum TaxID=164328 RepID=UPI00309BD062|nr:hypothetical protein KRP23_15070 [Phytophthora ramorum]